MPAATWRQARAWGLQHATPPRSWLRGALGLGCSVAKLLGVVRHRDQSNRPDTPLPTPPHPRRQQARMSRRALLPRPTVCTTRKHKTATTITWWAGAGLGGGRHLGAAVWTQRVGAGSLAGGSGGKSCSAGGGAARCMPRVRRRRVCSCFEAGIPPRPHPLPAGGPLHHHLPHQP